MGYCVPFNDDVELRELFHSEVTERSERLINGARAYADEPSVDLARDMHREGHTIKGIARMMGFSALRDAGKLLEETWRGIHEGEIAVTDGLARAVEGLSAELLPAADAHSQAGTPGLADAVRAVRRELRIEEPDPDDAAGEPRLPEGVAGLPVNAGRGLEGGDLGGLLGSIDQRAFGENVRVNAASLFRLINGICSLRVDTEALSKLLEELTGDLGDPAVRDASLARLGGSLAAAEKAVLDLQSRAIDLAATPLAEVTNTYPQLIKYLARKANKEIRFELVGDQLTIDRQVLECLSDPLRQLLVNAVEHGIEPAAERIAAGKTPTATLALRVFVEDQRMTIMVEDDGRGVDWDAVRRTALQRGLVAQRADDDIEALRAVLFSPNFSTASPSELVGDGNGLAMVAEAVEALHGSLRLETEPGVGTTVLLTVPTSRALQDAVLVTAAQQTWGIPELVVLDSLPLDAAEGVDSPQRSEMVWEGATIPAVSFAEAVGLVEPEPLTRALVVSSPSGPVALLVAEEIGRRQVAAREVGPILGGIPHLTGAALLGGGDVVVLVDPARLAERAGAVPGYAGSRPRVLVIDDSRGARQVVGGALGSAGFEVDLAGSPTEALGALREQEFDAIVTDYVLPTMDGTTLVKKVRELGIDVPVVVLSGQATAADQSRVLAAGADLYFDKDDVRRGALAAALRELIDGRRQQEARR